MKTISIYSKMLWLVFSLTAFAAAGSSTITEMISMASQQRMLAMGMLKNFVMMGSHSIYHDPMQELKAYQQTFMAHHKKLRQYDQSPEYQHSLDAVEHQLAIAGKMLNAVPDKSMAEQYLAEAWKLKLALDKTVEYLNRKAGTPTGHAVKLAGELRAISQKLAAIYLLKDWSSVMDKNMGETMQAFRNALDYLNQAPETTVQMRPLLKRIEKTYLFFAVMNDTEIFTPTLVVKKCDAFRNDAVELTRLYLEKAAK